MSTWTTQAAVAGIIRLHIASLCVAAVWNGVACTAAAAAVKAGSAPRLTHSCLRCRCYEVKCDTGTVIGNYSSSGVATPYNTSGGFQPKVNLSTVVDDYNRSWPGNPQLGEQQLFTQCWNLSQVSCIPLRLKLLTPCRPLREAFVDHIRNPPEQAAESSTLLWACPSCAAACALWG